MRRNPRAHNCDQALAAAAIVISPIVQGFTLEPLARCAGFGKTTAAGPSTKRPSPGSA